MKILKRRLSPTIILILVIAISALIAVIVDILESDLNIRKDMSFNGYATTGEETATALNQLDKKIEIYLLYQNDSEDIQLLQLLERYHTLSKQITIFRTDINKNPGILTKFKGNAQHATAADDIVVYCPDTERYRILTYDDFMVSSFNMQSGNYELSGVAYEKRLTEAILYVSQADIPVIGILTGHAELDLQSLSVLISYLRSHCYDVCQVDLSQQNTLSGIDLLLIASPQLDLSDSEAESIYSFIKDGGNLFVTKDYTDNTANMPNFNSLLKAYGITPIPGIVIASKEDYGSYYGDQISLIPYMQSTPITDGLLSANLDILLMPGACGFDITEDSATQSYILLKSGPNAYIRNVADAVNTIEKQNGDRSGEINLSILSEKMYADGNVSKVFVCGNSAMFINDYIYQRTFIEDFMDVLFKLLLPDTSESLPIEASAALRPALKAGCGDTATVIILIPPFLTLLAAVLILSLRKRR